MIRKLPLIPTLIVAAAMATMIALGFWQLRRADEKEALLTRYRAAEGLPAVVFPTIPIANEDVPLFRRATGHACGSFPGERPPAEPPGRDRFPAHRECGSGVEGPGMAVEMGWSKDPNAGAGWQGGEVSGTIAPDRNQPVPLVRRPALAA